MVSTLPLCRVDPPHAAARHLNPHAHRIGGPALEALELSRRNPAEVLLPAPTLRKINGDSRTTRNGDEEAVLRDPTLVSAAALALALHLYAEPVLLLLLARDLGRDQALGQAANGIGIELGRNSRSDTTDEIEIDVNGHLLICTRLIVDADLEIVIGIGISVWADGKNETGKDTGTGMTAIDRGRPPGDAPIRGITEEV